MANGTKQDEQVSLAIVRFRHFSHVIGVRIKSTPILSELIDGLPENDVVLKSKCVY